MRDVARVAALLVAVLIVARDHAIAGNAPALNTASLLVGFVLVAALSLWRDGFLTASAVALGGHYALALGYGHVQADLGAPVVAALLVVHLDLLDLAASLPRDRRIDRAFALARLRHLALVLGLGVAAGTAVLAIAYVPWPSSELFRAAGLAAAAGAVAAPLLLVRARR